LDFLKFSSKGEGSGKVTGKSPVAKANSFVVLPFCNKKMQSECNPGEYKQKKF